MKIKFLLLPLAAILNSGVVLAQDDTANIDSAYNYFDENLDGSGSDEPDKPVVKKPYIRIQCPYDSVTELITYIEIGDIKLNEEVGEGVDSLYFRAKNWIGNKWFPKVKNKDKELIKWVKDDLMGEKFKITLKVPLYIKMNRYKMSRNGELQFHMDFRCKDEGRYRIKITNLVHILPKSAKNPNGENVYCEFYRNAEKNIVATDMILRGMDAEVKRNMEELKKALKGRGMRTDEEEDEF